MMPKYEDDSPTATPSNPGKTMCNFLFPGVDLIIFSDLSIARDPIDAELVIGKSPWVENSSDLQRIDNKGKCT